MSLVLEVEIVEIDKAQYYLARGVGSNPIRILELVAIQPFYGTLLKAFLLQLSSERPLSLLAQRTPASREVKIIE